MRLKIKNIILTFFLVMICANIATISAQEVEIKDYSFLNTKADTLVLYGQSQRLFEMLGLKFQKLIKFGNSQINIMHIGDSHLQADLYTGETRKNFQSFLYGLDGSRGMVAPYVKAAPYSYNITFSSSWQNSNILHNSTNQGLWGTTAYTNAKENTIDIDVNGKNPIKYDFNTIRIYHSELGQGDNIFLDIETAYQKIYHHDKGYTEFILADYLQKVKIVINKLSNETFYLYGFYFNNDNPGVNYNITGTNGVTASNYLNADKFFTQLETIPTDLIIISLGTNDTYEAGGENTFEANLNKFVTQIRQTKGDVPILLTTPIECYHHKHQINPRQAQTVDIINNVAKNNSCAYLDMYRVFGGKGSADKLFRKKLMQNDKVHLTAKGYQLQGDLLFNALWNNIEKNL